MTRRVISVRDFGARGDWVHDDSAAFRRAFNYGSRSRRRRFGARMWLLLHNPRALTGRWTDSIPPGTYLLRGDKECP